MSSRSRFEMSSPKAIILAGPASHEDLSVLEALLCRHPRCSPVPYLGKNLLESLPDLSDYSETLESQDCSAQLASTWKRILKIELGNALLRSLSQVFSRMPGSVIVIKAPGLEGAEHCATFFPSTPMILVVSEGRSAAPAEELSGRLRSRGQPVRVLGMDALRTRESAPTQVLDFVNLPRNEFPWKSAQL